MQQLISDGILGKPERRGSVQMFDRAELLTSFKLGLVCCEPRAKLTTEQAAIYLGVSPRTMERDEGR